MKSRKTAMSGQDIADGIRKVKAFARDDLNAIHLAIPDFEKVKRNPPPIRRYRAAGWPPGHGLPWTPYRRTAA